MAIKVEAVDKPESEIKYPCLMESYDYLVLFDRAGCGMCLDGNYDDFQVFYSDEWAMGSFKPVKHAVTISNEE